MRAFLLIAATHVGLPVLLGVASLKLGCGTKFEACKGDDCLADGSGGVAGSFGKGGSGGTSGVGGSATSSASGTGGIGGSLSEGGAAGERSSTGGASGAGGDPGTGGSIALPCDGACAGHTPHCHEASDSCVACVDHEHCEAPTEYCSDAFECVECLENTMCVGATISRCDDGTCAPCETNEDCQHIEGKGVCDAGECVECTGKDYASCGLDDAKRPLVCDSLTRTCSDQPLASRGLCGDCVSDAACQVGMLCVQERFLPDGVDLGYVCQWQRGAEGAPALCLSAPPYVQTRSNVSSIDGIEANVCALRVSTCAAHTDFSALDCETETPDVVDSGLCGEPDLDDGLCVLFESNGEESVYRCTVPCLSDDDCRTNFTCDTAADPPRCNLQVGG